MRRPIESRLSEELKNSQFNFIERGVREINEIYDAVRIHFEEFCDDDYYCSQHCSKGNNQPEWKHVVRGRLDNLKNKTDLVRKQARRGYWIFV